MEPEIIDLSNFLNKMGAKIEGAGTNIIKITGVKNLKEAGYRIMPDRIETGTFLCMFAATGGNGKLINTNIEHIRPLISKLEETGCDIQLNDKYIEINAPRKLKATNIETMPYPGFPTDMQSIFSTMLCIAKGKSIVVENIFENRYKYAEELKKMGAKLNIDNRTLFIDGIRHLKNNEVSAKDLRGGAALVLAGLMTKGKTIVNNTQYIERGYEKLDEKLNLLGANIRKSKT